MTEIGSSNKESNAQEDHTERLVIEAGISELVYTWLPQKNFDFQVLEMYSGCILVPLVVYSYYMYTQVSAYYGIYYTNAYLTN